MTCLLCNCSCGHIHFHICYSWAFFFFLIKRNLSKRRLCSYPLGYCCDSLIYRFWLSPQEYRFVLRKCAFSELVTCSQSHIFLLLIFQAITISVSIVTQKMNQSCRRSIPATDDRAGPAKPWCPQMKLQLSDSRWRRIPPTH